MSTVGMPVWLLTYVDYYQATMEREPPISTLASRTLFLSIRFVADALGVSS
jgi:hypothetical protein